MDYILFVAGFLTIASAAILADIARIWRPGRMPRGLIVFGVAAGLYCWWEVIRTQLPVSLGWAGLLLALTAHVAMFGSGCALVFGERRRGQWLIFAATGAAAAISAAVLPEQRVIPAAGWILGIPGTAMAAAGFFGMRRGREGDVSRGLLLAGAGLGGFAFAMILNGGRLLFTPDLQQPSASFLKPALEMMPIGAYLAGLWIFHKGAVRRNAHRADEAAGRLSTDPVLGILLLLLLAAGWVYTEWTARHHAEALRKETLKTSALLAESVNRDDLRRLIADSSAAAPDVRKDIQSWLTSCSNVISGCRQAYLVAIRDGRPFVLADISTETPNRRLREKDVLQAQAASDWNAAFGGEPALHNPPGGEKDKWFSALAPIRDETGKVIAVLGMDVDAGTWKTALARQRMIGISMTFAAFGVLAAALVINRSTFQARLRLQRSERQFRTLANTAPLLIWQTDANLACIFVNQGWVEFTGRPAAQALGEGWLESIHPEDRERCKLLRKEASAERKPLTLEYRMLRTDGEYRTISESAAPDREGDRENAAYVGVGVDATDIRKSEAEVREVRKRLQGVIDAATQILIIATDVHGIITLFNTGAERMLGYRPDELIGRHKLDFLHLKAEVADHSNRLSETFGRTVGRSEALFEHAKRGHHEQREWTYVRKDGSRVIVDLVVTAIRGEHGLITGFLGVGADVTERKAAAEALRRSEQRFKDVATAAGEYIWECDAEGRFWFLTGRSEAVFGEAPLEMLGRTPFSFMPEAERRRQEQIFHGFAERREPFRDVDQQLDLPDGRVVWQRVSGVPITGQDGRFLGFRGAGQDITASKRAEKQIERNRELLQRINQTLLSLSPQYAENVQKLTALAGQVFHADSALYHRLEGDALKIEGSWNPPPEIAQISPAAGHPSCEAIRNSDHYAVIANFQKTPFAEADRSLRARQIETYVGHGVAVAGETIGSLSILFARSFAPTEDARNVLAIIAQAIGREELLHRGQEKLQQTVKDLDTQRTRQDVLIRNMRGGVLMENSDGTVALVNERFCEIFGCSSEEILSSNSSSVTRRTAQAVGDPSAFILRTEHLIKVGRPSTAEVIETRDGRFLQRDFVPIRQAGALTGRLWHYRDITQDRRNLRIVEAVAHLNSTLLRTRLDRETWVAAARLLGKATGVNGLYVFENVPHPSSGRPAMSQIARWTRHAGDAANLAASLEYESVHLSQWPSILSSGREIRVLESEMTGPMREIFDSERSSSLFVMPILVGGKLWGFIALAEGRLDEVLEKWVIGLLRSVAATLGLRLARQHDEDSLITATEAARRAAETADAANRAKSTFLATMSHEIRTPLNAVVGMASLLLDTNLDKDQRHSAEMVVRASETLLELINDILDYSKIESGNVDIEDAPFHLEDAVIEPIEMVSRTAADKGVEISYYLDPKTPPTVKGDRVRLKQVLLNLLSNAVKFTDEGEVIVRVTRREAGDGVVQLDFSVQDTGIGIREEVRDRLFSAFVQADSSVTRRYGGTGLGLAISKRLVELMGGTIGVRSRPKGGSEFYFSIRLKADDSQLGAPGREEDALRQKSVLIVDDNAVNRRLLDENLRLWGMETTVAGSAAEALKHVEEGAVFDVAVLDDHMPGMDGIELARRIRESRLHAMPLVLLSSEHRQRQAGRELVDIRLVGPVRPKRLREALAGFFCIRQPAKANVPPPESQDFSHLRILAAEDNPNNQIVLRLLLKTLGCTPVVVDDGQQALNRLGQETFDVGILDVQMPVMDGLSAARAIRELFPGAERPFLLALTADAFRESRDACMAAGFDAYLPKPVTLKKLREALATAIDRSRRRS